LRLSGAAGTRSGTVYGGLGGLCLRVVSRRCWGAGWPVVAVRC
jgi:hypothetical protein